MSKMKWAYGILEGHNIDTADMSPKEAIDKIKELREAGELSPQEAATCDGILGKDKKAQATKDNTSNVKEQMRASKDKLKGRKPVASITGDKVITDYKTATATLQAALSKNGGVVTRKGFGNVQVAARLKKARAYIKDPAEIATLAAVPAVIKNGIQIAHHTNHKGRGYPTFTFAANVQIGNTVCMVAVVVKRTKGDFYDVHRVLTENGEEIKIKSTD